MFVSKKYACVALALLCALGARLALAAPSLGGADGPSDGEAVSRTIMVAQQDGPQPAYDLAIAEFALLEKGARRRVDQVMVGQQVIVWLRIQQSGGPAANAYKYSLFVDDILRKTGWLNVNQRSAPIFAQGDIESDAILFDTPGQHHLRVVTDPDNQVAETNEQNNTRILTVTVLAPGQGMDLALEQEYIAFHGANPPVALARVATGQRIIFHVVVRNNGPRPIQDVPVIAQIDGRTVSRSTVTLGPGEGHNKELLQERVRLVDRWVYGYAFDRPGRYRITAILDPDNQVEEVNEGNNRVERWLEVVQGAPVVEIVPAKPDIAVTRVTMISESRAYCDDETEAGQQNYVVVHYLYDRPLTAPNISGVGAHAVMGNQVVPTRPIPMPSPRRLGGSEIRAIAVIDHVFPQPGEYTVAIAVRPEPPYAESDEGNNVRTIRVRVHPAGTQRGEAPANCRSTLPPARGR